MGNLGSMTFSGLSELTIVIPVGFEGVVDLTDIGCCTTERYSLTVDGTSMGETSVPSYEENFGGDMNDPDRGFSFSDWSSGTFIVGAGEHSLLVDTTEVGTLFTTWGAYIRVTLRAVGGGGGRQSYDQWDDDAFSAATPTSERAPDKNPDGDELNNAMEYLTGSDPESETTESPFESGLDGGVFEVSYRRSKKVSAGAETVETSETFSDDWDVNASASIATKSIDDDYERVTVRIPVGELDRLFWRVRLLP